MLPVMVFWDFDAAFACVLHIVLLCALRQADLPDAHLQHRGREREIMFFSGVSSGIIQGPPDAVCMSLCLTALSAREAAIGQRGLLLACADGFPTASAGASIMRRLAPVFADAGSAMGLRL